VLPNASTAARTLPIGPAAFGIQGAGTTSPAQTITVQSTGDAALRVTRAVTSGTDAAD